MYQSRIVLSSTLALSLYIALVFHLVSSENASKNSIQRRVGIIRQNVGYGDNVMYAGQVVKIECLKVNFECLKVRFEWLKGQRSVQHPEGIRVN